MRKKDSELAINLGLDFHDLKMLFLLLVVAVALSCCHLIVYCHCFRHFCLSKILKTTPAWLLCYLRGSAMVTRLDIQQSQNTLLHDDPLLQTVTNIRHMHFVYATLSCSHWGILPLRLLGCYSVMWLGPFFYFYRLVTWGLPYH